MLGAKGRCYSLGSLESGWRDSNSRPLRSERSTLPTALHPEFFYHPYCTKEAGRIQSMCTAFVAQWIEQTRPKGKIGVRFPSRAQKKEC